MDFSAEVKFIGDTYPGAYAHGISMIGSETMKRFTTKTAESPNEKAIQFATEEGIALSVELTQGKNEAVTICRTSIDNHSKDTVTLEMITSFYLTDIKADKIHRMLSCWSSEGRHLVEDLRDINMEASWTKHAPRIHKFGNVGSMPVRSYFPFLALEDGESGAFVGISLYSPSSWQMEIIRHHEEDRVNVAGGIADRDFGHWTKVLAPGDHFDTPKAVVAVGNSLLEVCSLLVEEQSPNISPVDDGMGIAFNEYCTTWGNPTIDNLKQIADKLAGKGIQYLVMDSGWYLEEGQYWWDHIGKWEVNPKRFPNGLKELTEYIREKGMIPGIWFEPESLAWGCSLYNDTDYVLTRDGYPLTVGGKRFLDMESEKVRSFLREKVIGLLKKNDFGYIKIDYNDTIGIGCDGPESLGENLRRKVLASQDFFRELRKEIPDLVIENCSSGGHRLEASMMELASMASFSDAHETTAIPLIAASLQRLVRPEQNQIWAVLRKEDSDARIYFSMVSTFLGRMGLSGDIYDLTDHQWELVDEGIAFYMEVAPIIKNGRTIYLENNVRSWNDPKGWQAVVRRFGNKSLVIMHRFGDLEDADKTYQKLNEPIGMAELEAKYGKLVRGYGNLEQPYSAVAMLMEGQN